MNIMMDHNFFNADPWQTDTYATKYGAYMASQNAYIAQMSCNALLGFGLPAADGEGLRGQAVVGGHPEQQLLGRRAYMLGMLHVSGTFHLWY